MSEVREPEEELLLLLRLSISSPYHSRASHRTNLHSPFEGEAVSPSLSPRLSLPLYFCTLLPTRLRPLFPFQSSISPFSPQSFLMVYDNFDYGKMHDQ